MTTKQKIKVLVERVAALTAIHFNICDPDDVSQRHVDFAYKMLWANDKLNVELNTDASMIKRSICEIVDEWNLSMIEDEADFEYAYYEESAA